LYPTVIEPWLQLQATEDSPTWQTQVMVWTIGYAVFVALVIGCAILVWMAISNKIETPEEPAAPQPTPAPAPAAEQTTAVTATAPVGLTKRKARLETAPAAAPAPDPTPPVHVQMAPNDNITWLRRIRWIGLAAVPSSLMLGVTTYMTTD